jgi:hypothetical protein
MYGLILGVSRRLGRHLRLSPGAVAGSRALRVVPVLRGVLPPGSVDWVRAEHSRRGMYYR